MNNYSFGLLLVKEGIEEEGFNFLVGFLCFCKVEEVLRIALLKFCEGIMHGGKKEEPISGDWFCY